MYTYIGWDRYDNDDDDDDDIVSGREWNSVGQRVTNAHDMYGSRLRIMFRRVHVHICWYHGLVWLVAVTNTRALLSFSQANDAFKSSKFPLALRLYSEAIDRLEEEGLGTSTEAAKYFANRAYANLKLENYGAAVADGERAIELDTSFAKGYYRKGAACMALGRFKEGRDCFRRVAKATGSRDAQIKLKECESAIRRIRFEEAISSPESSHTASISYGDSVHPNTMEVEDSYMGTRMDDDAVRQGDYARAITPEVIESMIEGFKNQSLIHKKYAFVILSRVKQILEASPTIEEIDVPEGKHFTVCGDVHGQFFDLCNIFEINGRPSPENPYLFNGDFVDRGSFSVEVIFTLFGYKCLYPDAMFMTRGNHEAKSMNRMYGFDGEVRAKYSNLMAEFFAEIFCFLPLGCVLNSKVLVVHGGLFSRPDVTLDDLKKIDRNREPPESGDMCDILWSDPMDEDGMGPSKRGVAVNFGPDVTRAFLENNNLELLVRSHEMKEEGYEVAHGGKCITIFSAPNYCDQMGNMGAFIRFEHDMVPKFTQFSAVPHPPSRPMQYAGMNGFF